MITKIQKWGNSLAVRLPKYITDSLQLNNDSRVTISAQDGMIIIKPETSVFKLEDLLSLVNESNLHRETETGYPRGNEI